MSERKTPLRSIIVNSEDAAALRGAAERIGLNFFIFPSDDEAKTEQES